MMLVILSGIYGIAAYAIAARRRSATTAREMTGPQMIDAVEQHRPQIQIAAQPLVRRGQPRSCSARSARIRSAAASAGGCPAGYPRGGNARGAARDPRAGWRETRGRGGDRARSGRRCCCSARRRRSSRIRRHVRIRAMLEIWLYVHVPLTFALIAALAAHIISVFFYW